MSIKLSLNRYEDGLVVETDGGTWGDVYDQERAQRSNVKYMDHIRQFGYKSLEGDDLSEINEKIEKDLKERYG